MLADNSEYRQLLEFATDAVPAAIVAVHHSGTVVLANAAARELLRLSDADIGCPFDELEISERPVELQSAVERVQKEQRPLILEHAARTDDPTVPECLEIHLVPVVGADGTAEGVVLTFVDVSLSRRLEEQVERSRAERRAAYGELQVANELLGTTTGELRSTIEELEAMDDRLRSTNEELETVNRELHWTRDELQALGQELRRRTTELHELNDFLEAVLISQPGAVVVIDRDLRICVSNERSAELWGLRTDEAPGQHFLNLDIGLPVEELRGPLRAILAGHSESQTVELAASNRRGREFRCRVSMRPLVNRAGETRGAILVMAET